MFFDEETLEYIEKYGSLSPQKQPNSRFVHLLGSGMAESISALGKSFNMFNSTKIQCETYESHLIVPFEVSGASGTVSSRALLDTGASTTMISSELINMTGSADLVYAPQRSFNTANGYLRCPVINRSIGIGDMKRNIEVAVNNTDNMNLLGMNFFEGFEYIIDAGDACIYVWKK
jgi:predicted aspartyl protease